MITATSGWRAFACPARAFLALACLYAFAAYSPSFADPQPTQQALAQDLAKAFFRQIYRCWNPPDQSSGKQGVVVRLKVRLDIDGRLAAPPELNDQIDSSDPDVQNAIERATMAANSCAPYKLPVNQYSAWKEIVIVFDPRLLQVAPR